MGGTTTRLMGRLDSVLEAAPNHPFYSPWRGYFPGCRVPRALLRMMIGGRAATSPLSPRRNASLPAFAIWPPGIVTHPSVIDHIARLLPRL